MARNVRMAHNRGNKAKAPRIARTAKGIIIIIIIIMVTGFVYEFDTDYVMSICSHDCLHLSL
jgi:hypothetical protein